MKPVDDFQRQLGLALQRARKLSGLTQAELAKEILASRMTIVRYENGAIASLPYAAQMLEMLLSRMSDKQRLSLESVRKELQARVQRESLLVHAKGIEAALSAQSRTLTRNNRVAGVKDGKLVLRNAEAPVDPVHDSPMAVQRLDLNALASDLKRAREEAGLSQQQLARAARVGRATVARYEAGKIAKYSELTNMLNAIIETGRAGVSADNLKVGIEVVSGAVVKGGTLHQDADVQDLVDEMTSSLMDLQPRRRQAAIDFISGYLRGIRSRD